MAEAAPQEWVQLPHASVIAVLSPYPGRQLYLPPMLGLSGLTSLSS